MFAKLFAVFCLLCICMATHIYWNDIVQPDITANKAIDQMSPAATDQPAQDMRVWQHIQQMPNEIIWGVFALGIITIFMADILRLCKSATKIVN